MTDLPEAVRHVRRGTTYRVLGYATLQSHKPLPDGEKMVVYRASDGSMWVRPATDFLDGRFEAVELPEEDDDVVHCEGCGKVIRPGDMCHPDTENSIYVCADCAPSWEDMLAEPEAFRNGPAAGDRDGEPMTHEEAEAAIAKHLAGGGALTDKIVSRF